MLGHGKSRFAKKTISLKGSKIGIQHEMLKKMAVNLVMQYDDSHWNSITSVSDWTASACLSEMDYLSDEDLTLGRLLARRNRKTKENIEFCGNSQTISCHVQSF